MRNRGGRGKIITILTILLLIFLAIFYYLMNRNSAEEKAEVLSDTKKVLYEYDLSINYPPTPKTVVEYYAKLSRCMYDTGNSAEDIEELATQSRLLFDEELLQNQTYDQYLQSLKAEIKSFEKDRRKIVNFSLSSASDVEYDTNSNGELATLYCMFTMQKDNLTYSDNEEFILRRDEDKHWKILGWRSAARN